MADRSRVLWLGGSPCTGKSTVAGLLAARHGLRVYAERGAERVGLKVDDSNPTGAPRLYASLGFETDRRYERWSKLL